MIEQISFRELCGLKRSGREKELLSGSELYLSRMVFIRGTVNPVCVGTGYKQVL